MFISMEWVGDLQNRCSPRGRCHERVVDYVFKTIKRGRFTYDEGVLILPRRRDELTSKGLQRGLVLGDRLVPT